METWFAVLVGGAIGSAARHGVDSLTLVERGATASALANLIGQIAFGSILVYVGFNVGTRWPD